MKRFTLSFAAGLLGDAIGLFGGMGLMSVLSSNSHDGSIEAAMAGAFVVGPLTVIVSSNITFIHTT